MKKNPFLKNVFLDNIDEIVKQYNLNAERYFENELNFNINPDGLKEIQDSAPQDQLIIVDVRSEKFFKAGHIPGAINIPFDKYNYFSDNNTDFPFLVKNNFNYVYCYSLLCMLGQKACKKFASLGYPVKEVKGGFQSWQDYGYDIEI